MKKTLLVSNLTIEIFIKRMKVGKYNSSHARAQWTTIAFTHTMNHVKHYHQHISMFTLGCNLLGLSTKEVIMMLYWKHLRFYDFECYELKIVARSV